MSIECVKAVLDGPRSLDNGPLKVLLALAEWANEHGCCWYSVPKIADRARLEVRATQYALRALVAAGYLVIEEGRGLGHTSRYWIQEEQLRLRAEQEAAKEAEEASKKAAERQARKVPTSTPKGAKGATITAPFNTGNMQPTAPLEGEKVHWNAPIGEPKGAVSNIIKVQFSTPKGAITDAPKPLRTTREEPLEERERGRESLLDGHKARTRSSGKFDVREFLLAPERRAWAEDMAPGIDVEWETDKFLGRNTDAIWTPEQWDGQWRNWIRRWVEMGGAGAFQGGRKGAGRGGNSTRAAPLRALDPPPKPRNVVFDPSTRKKDE